MKIFQWRYHPATFFQTFKTTFKMKKLKKDIRFWLLIAATLTMIFSIEKAREIPPQAKAVAEASTGNITIDGIFAGFVVIFFATMLVCVQQHIKNAKSNQENI